MTQIQRNINFQKECKAKYTDSPVVIFRTGDCYEVYNEDAMTLKDVAGCNVFFNRNEHCKFAFFKCSQLDIILPKIIRSGHRICICDQVM